MILPSVTSGMSRTRLPLPVDAGAPSLRASDRSDSSYSNLEKDFRVGKKVYLRSSKTHIGTIIAIDPHHPFPPSFNRRLSRALLIKRKDGPLDWIPVDGALRIYVVKRP